MNTDIHNFEDDHKENHIVKKSKVELNTKNMDIDEKRLKIHDNEIVQEKKNLNAVFTDNDGKYDNFTPKSINKIFLHDLHKENGNIKNFGEFKILENYDSDRVITVDFQEKIFYDKNKDVNEIDVLKKENCNIKNVFNESNKKENETYNFLKTEFKQNKLYTSIKQKNNVKGIMKENDNLYKDYNNKFAKNKTIDNIGIANIKENDDIYNDYKDKVTKNKIIDNINIKNIKENNDIYKDDKHEFTKNMIIENMSENIIYYEDFETLFNLEDANKENNDVKKTKERFIEEYCNIHDVFKTDFKENNHNNENIDKNYRKASILKNNEDDINSENKNINETSTSYFIEDNYNVNDLGKISLNTVINEKIITEKNDKHINMENEYIDEITNKDLKEEMYNRIYMDINSLNDNTKENFNLKNDGDIIMDGTIQKNFNNANSDEFKIEDITKENGYFKYSGEDTNTYNIKMLKFDIVNVTKNTLNGENGDKKDFKGIIIEKCEAENNNVEADMVKKDINEVHKGYFTKESCNNENPAKIILNNVFNEKIITENKDKDLNMSNENTDEIINEGLIEKNYNDKDIAIINSLNNDIKENIDKKTSFEVVNSINKNKNDTSIENNDQEKSIICNKFTCVNSITKRYKNVKTNGNITELQKNENRHTDQSISNTNKTEKKRIEEKNKAKIVQYILYTLLFISLIVFVWYFSQ